MAIHIPKLNSQSFAKMLASMAIHTYKYKEPDNKNNKRYLNQKNVNLQPVKELNLYKCNHAKLFNIVTC